MKNIYFGMSYILSLGEDIDKQVEVGYIYNTSNWSTFFNYYNQNPRYEITSLRLVEFLMMGEVYDQGIYNISYSDLSGQNIILYFLEDKYGPWSAINKIQSAYGTVYSCELTNLQFVQIT